MKTKFWYPEHSNIGNAQIGEDCVIHSHVWIGDGVKIGNRVHIQAFSFIPFGVTLEDDVFIGPRVTFCNDKNPPSGRDKWQPTLVCKNAVIGAGAIILPKIIIGEGAMIGAGAVVTRSVLPGEVVVGNPAKFLRMVNEKSGNDYMENAKYNPAWPHG